MSAAGFQPGARAGPRALDAPEPMPCSESESFDRARAAGIPRPRPRCAARPPVDPACPRCGAYAPPAAIYTRESDEQAIELQTPGEELARACLRCVSQRIEEVA